MWPCSPSSLDVGTLATQGGNGVDERVGGGGWLNQDPFCHGGRGPCFKVEVTAVKVNINSVPAAMLQCRQTVKLHFPLTCRTARISAVNCNATKKSTLCIRYLSIVNWRHSDVTAVESSTFSHNFGLATLVALLSRYGLVAGRYF